jgi:signal transduction histidine kinase
MCDARNRYGAEIILQLPNNPVHIACRKIEFEELIYCLITNALQANVPSRPPQIKVELVSLGEMATISITDNGSGILEQSIDSIFDCFFTTKSEENGTGLGLAIVRHIVESHGGTASVSSEVNMGSTFVLKLPLAHGDFNAETFDSIYC